MNPSDAEDGTGGIGAREDAASSVGMGSGSERGSRSPLRIVDVALNRALEAVRVLDDASRFLLNDPTTTATAKSMRAELRALVETLPGSVAARDVVGDVGTGQTGAAEMDRRSPADVAHAAGHRLAESLRSVEEWGKLIDPSIAELAKALRYRGYALHQAVASRLPGSAPQWRLCVLVTESICRRPWDAVVEAAVAAGADCIQIREKELGDAALLDRARRTVEIVADRAAVVINDRVDVALLAGADGVHLGAEDFDLPTARALAGHQLLVGASAHTVEEADAAVAAGADLIGVGTIFASRTKPRAVAGPTLLEAVLARHPEVPHLAIGGIDAERAGELAAIGCRGVAVSAAVCGSDDPQAATLAILDSLARAIDGAEQRER